MIARTFLRRILLRSLAAASITALVAWVTVYQLVSQSIVERAIDDDLMAAEQTVLQLEAFFDHVTYSAIEVIVEPDVRRTLLALESNSRTLNPAQETALRRRLRLLAASRPYMHSLAVMDLRGGLYWSFLLPGEIVLEMNEEDQPAEHEIIGPIDIADSVVSVPAVSSDILLDVLPAAESYLRQLPRDRIQTSFTERFLVTAGEFPVEVFGMVVPIRGLAQADRHFGYLVVNIHIDHMRDIIRRATAQFDGYLWLDGENRVVVSSGMPAYLLETVGNGDEWNTLVHRTSSGRTVTIQGFGPDWQILLYSSNAPIQEQSLRNAQLQAVFTLGALALLIGLLTPTLANLVRPVHELSVAMERVAQGDLEVRVPVAKGEEMMRLTDGFNTMTRDLQDHIESLIRYEQEVKRMEYDLLAAQVNPHFIYNTLNSVIYLARQERSEDISTMVSSLISILQDTLRINADAVLEKLDTELRMSWHYMVIQRYRYGDMYSTQWKINPDSKQLYVPRSIVQPLVENALFHGILPTGRQCNLTIAATHTTSTLSILVEDDGEGMSADTLEKVRERMVLGSRTLPNSGTDSMKSIGLRNIYMRLSHIYGSDFEMCINSTEGAGTQVELILPALEDRIVLKNSSNGPGGNA